MPPLLHITTQHQAFQGMVHSQATLKQALLLLKELQLGDALNVVRQSVDTLVGVTEPDDQDSLSHRAFRLLSKALLYGCLVHLKRATQLEQLTVLEQCLDRQLKDVPVTLTAALFQDPRALPFLKSFEKIYLQWLRKSLDLPKHRIKDLKSSFKDHFWDGLVVAWADEAEYFRPLYEYFNSPWTDLLAQRARHNQYRAQLQSWMDEPAFDNRQLSLRYLYLEPSFNRYQTTSKTSPTEGFGYTYTHLTQYLVNKIAYDDDLFKQQEKRLVFLLGQPGQGKTSFCYHLLSELLALPDLQCPVYFIKFRHLNAHQVRRLVQAPFQVLAEHLQQHYQLHLSFDRLQNSRLVLLLDGLDELYMVNGLTNEHLESLYTQLTERVSRCPKWTLLLTSRYHHIHPEYLHPKHSLVLRLALLSLEQQQTWLARYESAGFSTTLTDERLTLIHKQLPHIEELIRQPILLHIVARANINIDRTDTRSSLYQQLFDTVLERQWDQHQQLPKYQRLQQQPALFRTWLQEMAFCIHTRRQEYLPHETFLALPTTQRVQQLVAQRAEPDDILKDLLVCFYFQNVRTTENDQPRYALEFLHKSLQEYLTVEYFFAQLQQHTLQPTSPERERAVLQLFFDWFGTKRLTPNVQAFLEELLNQLDPVVRLEVRRLLQTHFAQGLAQQFLCPYTTGTALPPMQQATQVFEGYWGLLVRLQPALNRDLIAPEHKNAFCRLLQSADLSPAFCLRGIDLSGTDVDPRYFRRASVGDITLHDSFSPRAAVLSGVCWVGADLSDSDFSGAVLARANLCMANGRGADFRWVDFRGSVLCGVEFNNALLSGAQFEGATLGRLETKVEPRLWQLLNQLGDNATKHRRRRPPLWNTSYRHLPAASLEGAELKSACFKRAQLVAVDGSSADLLGADLQEVEGTKARFVKANLNGTNLEGADFSSADFSSASIISANLTQTILEGANFSSADLRTSDLPYTHLRKAILNYTDLRYTCLRQADLREATFFGSQFGETDLSGADLRFAHFANTSLLKTDLRGANLCHTSFENVTFDRVVLDHAKVSTDKFFAYLQQSCQGITALMKQYRVSDTLFYDDQDEARAFPYYLILPRE